MSAPVYSCMAEVEPVLLSAVGARLRKRPAAPAEESVKPAKRAASQCGAAGAPEVVDLTSDEPSEAVPEPPFTFCLLELEAEKDGVVKLWGVNASGSVLVTVRDFRQHCYIDAPPGCDQAALPAYAAALREYGPAPLLHSIELVQRIPALYFRARGPETVPYLRLVGEVGVAPSALVQAAAAIGLLGEQLHVKSWARQSYEDNVTPTQRFLVDTGCSGGGWVSVSGGARILDRTSTATLEVEASVEGVKRLSPDALQQGTGDVPPSSGLPPLKLMLLDVTLRLAPPQAAAAEGKGKGRGKAKAAAAPLPASRTPAAHNGDVIALISCVCAPLPAPGAHLRPQRRVVFTWPREQAGGVAGARLHAHGTEEGMLRAFMAWVVNDADPDIVCTFQNNDSWGAILLRCAALRLPPRLGRERGRDAKLAGVVNYSPAAVKQAGRMNANSNQETFQVKLGGRLAFDMVRQAVVGIKLCTYTLADMAATVLGEHAEVISPADALQLWAEGGYVLGGAKRGEPPSHAPFLLHPLQAGTTGMHGHTAVLDLVSSYPAIVLAHNLSTDTLLHPDDCPGVLDKSGVASRLTEAQVRRVPGGAAFVTDDVRRGLFPMLLSALVKARAVARAAGAAAAAAGDAEGAATLELRQRAFKLLANASYGFTGAEHSPMQCYLVADACLALGSLACRSAIEAMRACPTLAGCTVIYGQTDSLFLAMPEGLSDAAAFAIAARAAEVASAALPPPMRFALERVFSSLLLLHVNRYAGCVLDAARPGQPGELLSKGLKSEWRQSPPLLRRLLLRCLDLILVRRDCPAALALAKSEIRRLLTGDVSLGELTMTFGLWRTGRSELKGDGEGVGAEQSKAPHTALALRMAQRDPGLQPGLGDRVPFVLLSGFALQADAAEEPVKALRDGAAPDVALYWAKKVKTSLAEVFSHILSADALADLLNGEHTRVVAPRGSGALGHHFKPTLKCLSLRCPNAVADAAALCAACGAQPGRGAAAQLRWLEALNAVEECVARCAAAHMRAHSGGLFGRVLCQSADCALVFESAKAETAAEVARAALARLANIDY